eukprot:TRINITY_DN2046_c0_g1_i1.p1 TRINITY_DN2046_c0_g1~~TRINITY_DN2046_c0_g1_i1.p1  ORF type:complete len:661 (+),score=136.30 TRINITY_DN2046_c0_g1_i1:57-1985(+)
MERAARALQWVQQLALLPGESGLDRTRKELVVPLYGLFSVLCPIWAVYLLITAASMDGRERTGGYLHAGSMTGTFVFMAPAAVYIMRTKRISRELCEFPVVACVLTIVAFDFGNILQNKQSTVGYSVLVLDCLLLCNCSDRATVAVLTVSIVWTLVRALLFAANVQNDACHDVELFTPAYFMEAFMDAYAHALILFVDFRFTRGFARSMREQKGLVEASIQVSELAAVRLSKYETDATRALLEGPEGHGLPEGLRDALLQLVANLAQYRPYLPQSCLPDGGDSGADDRPDNASADGLAAMQSVCSESLRTPHSESARERDSGSLPSSRMEHPAQLRSIVSGVSLAVEVKNRSVSAVAVNSKSFLHTIHERVYPPSVNHFVRCEVDLFHGAVAAERGVVDVICGDHMFANFNAARICTTHRVSAARVAWGTRNTGEPATLHAHRTRRTAAVCSGRVLCGDFGTMELRRFMLVGLVPNTLQCLERVASQANAALVDETVGGDAEVEATFFCVLLERLLYHKLRRRPFLVWQLMGNRAMNVSPAEWMYELARQEANPHEEWNVRMLTWLNFGGTLSAQAPSRALRDVNLLGERQQSVLVETTVVGDTVALSLETASPLVEESACHGPHSPTSVRAVSSAGSPTRF